MMELKVLRDRNNGDTTLGRLLIDDVFECFTLEDEPREKKVKGETRIPAGRYEIKLRTEGGFHARYSERFPYIHKGMLHVTNVPGFQWILIHCGNSEKDTDGCLLVGKRIADWLLADSTNAYKQLYPKVADQIVKGERVFITYIDRDEEA
jgi:hypothetical protein